MKSISINQSINKKRLVYKLDIEVVFSYLIMYFLCLVLPVGTILVLISDIQHNRILHPISYLIMGLVDFWMLAGLYYTNKLYLFYDKLLIDYKNEIMSVLKEKYPNIEFTFKEPMLIRGEKELGFLKMRARIITIILSDNGIYINFLNTFRGENFSPIQGIYNYFRSKNLAKDILSRISIDNELQ